MSQPTRRTFLAATGAGVAALGVAGLPSVAAASEAPADLPTEPTPQAAAAGGPLLAAVTDLRAGSLTVLHGESEISVVDRDLARRIARLSAREA